MTMLQDCGMKCNTRMMVSMSNDLFVCTVFHKVENCVS